MTTKVKWLVSLLAVSLAANIFAAGMMLGKGFRGEGRHPAGPPVADFSLKRLGKHLNEDDRKKARDILRSARRELGPRFRDMKMSERRIVELMAAAEVDKEALATAMTNHGDLMRKLHEPVRKVMLDVVAELDHETRQKIAADMFKRSDRRGKRRGDRPPFGGPRGDGPPAHDRKPPHNPDEQSEPKPEPASL